MNTDNQVRKNQTYNCNKNYSRLLKVLQKKLVYNGRFQHIYFSFVVKKIDLQTFCSEIYKIHIYIYIYIYIYMNEKPVCVCVTQ